MLNAPTADSIMSRLREVPLEPWGPDGVRYVAILFWNLEGYRELYNQIDGEQWGRFDQTSGEIWDLFLAGCQRYVPDESGLSLTSGNSPVCWSESRSNHLADYIAKKTRSTAYPWAFEGPLELVVTGARRAGNDIDIDWRSTRSTKLDAADLPRAIAAYTNSHHNLESSQEFPSPGDFGPDKLPSTVVVDILRIILPMFAGSGS